MKWNSYLFFLPALIAVTLLVCYALSWKSLYRLLVFDGSEKHKNGKKLLQFLSGLISSDTWLYGFYVRNILKYSKIRIEELFRIKLIILVCTFIMLLLVKYTNISIQTREIFSSFDYRTDLIYQYKNVVDEGEALKQEIGYVKLAIATYKKSELVKAAEDMHQKIKALIGANDGELLLPKDTVVNKVYNRIVDYYEIRKFNIFLYVLISILASFIPEIFFRIRNTFAEADAKKELQFLKKLIIMNGSIKPVNFNELLKVLIDKSKYYNSLLRELEEKNSQNTVNKKTLYFTYIKNSKGMAEKLFFEKLDEANNYDFDQAITNIENEFRLEKREIARNIRKRIEAIHIIGILGFMAIIFIMVMYMIIPWMETYNMNQIGFYK